MSGNLFATISDRLPKFATIPNMFENTASNKSNIYEIDWHKFSWGNFILNYFSIDWQHLLELDKLNVDNSLIRTYEYFVRYICTSQNN